MATSLLGVVSSGAREVYSASDVRATKVVASQTLQSYNAADSTVAGSVMQVLTPQSSDGTAVLPAVKQWELDLQTTQAGGALGATGNDLRLVGYDNSGLNPLVAMSVSRATGEVAFPAGATIPTLDGNVTVTGTLGVDLGLTVVAGGALVSAGDITATTGDLVATAGDITAAAGTVSGAAVASTGLISTTGAFFGDFQSGAGVRNQCGIVSCAAATNPFNAVPLFSGLKADSVVLCSVIGAVPAVGGVGTLLLQPVAVPTNNTLTINFYDAAGVQTAPDAAVSIAYFIANY